MLGAILNLASFVACVGSGTGFDVVVGSIIGLPHENLLDVSVLVVLLVFVTPLCLQ